MASDINDPFHRQLYRIITEKIDDRMSGISSGVCGDYETYRQEVGYLQALGNVLDWCSEIEKARYGDAKKDDEQI
jgi:hypothetical protein